MPRSFLALTLPILSILSLAACGGGEPGAGGAGGTGTGTGGGGGTTTSTTTTSAPPIADCAEINATECFSNLDCASASDRCENRGTYADPVACCVPGARGTGTAGDVCVDEKDCDTAVCILDVPSPGTNLCSKECTTDADCPASLPTCVKIMIGAGAFCT